MLRRKKPEAPSRNRRCENREKAPESSFERRFRRFTMLKKTGFRCGQALNYFSETPEHNEVNHLLANLYYQKKTINKAESLQLIGLEKKADVFR